MFTYLVELVTRIEAEETKTMMELLKRNQKITYLIVSSLGIKSPPLNAKTGLCDTWLRGLGE